MPQDALITQKPLLTPINLKILFNPTDWLTVWLPDWLTVWLPDWLMTDSLSDCLTDWWLTHCLTDWLANGCLTVRLADDCLTDWLWLMTDFKYWVTDYWMTFSLMTDDWRQTRLISSITGRSRTSSIITTSWSGSSSSSGISSSSVSSVLSNIPV